MKTVSLKIDDAIFSETEKILARIKKPRNRYINEGIEYYNKLQRKQYLEKRLQMESELVKEDSMSVLRDFESILILLDLEPQRPFLTQAKTKSTNKYQTY